MSGTQYSAPRRLNIRTEALVNTDYRRVIDTTQQMQQVLMHITPTDGGIERETHLYTTQIITVISGRGEAIIDGQPVSLPEGSSIIVPANTVHEIFNRTDKPLVLHTIYAPPVHKPGLVQRTRYGVDKEQQGTSLQRRNQATQSTEEPTDHEWHWRLSKIPAIRRAEEQLKALQDAGQIVGSVAERRQSLESMSVDELEAYHKLLAKVRVDSNQRLRDQEYRKGIRDQNISRLRRAYENRSDKKINEEMMRWEAAVFDLENKWPERPRITSYEDAEKYIGELREKLP